MITMNIQSSGDDLVKKLTEVPFKRKPARSGHPSTYADDLKLLHELQVQQLEIELHNHALRSSQLSLEELNQKQVELFEFAPNGYFALGLDGSIRDVNLTGADLMGLSKSQLTDQLFSSFIHPEDQQTMNVCWFNLVKTNDYQVFKARIPRADSPTLFVRIALAISENVNGKQILLAMTDVTLMKQIEDAQQFLLGCSWTLEGKDFFCSLAEYLSKNLGMGFVSIDKILDNDQEVQTMAVYWEDRFHENFRYSLTETVFNTMVEHKSFCVPSGACQLFPDHGILQKTNAESYTVVTLWGAEGKPIGLISVIGQKQLADSRLIEMVLKQVSIRAAAELEHRQLEDAITKSRDKLEVVVKQRTAELEQTNEQLRNEIFMRRQHEQSLLLAEEKYRTVADFNFDWETWMSPEGTFIYVSPSCMRISGYAAWEFMQDPSLFMKIAHPDDREKIRIHLSDELMVHPSSSWTFDYRIITRQGEERWIGHFCQPVFDARGRFLGQRGSNRDITQRKMAESILLDSQKHLRQLTQRMDAIAEEERIRIAREIHDELGHLLTALKSDMDILVTQKGVSVKSMKHELEQMMDMVDSLIDSVRKIATDLRPGILDHLGLFPAIEWQIRQFSIRTKIACSFSQGEMDVVFDKNQTILIYRILQEMLTNIVRHSKATHVNVELKLQEQDFLMKVSDNGIGFQNDENNRSHSLGLMGMQERALSIGGELQIQSAPGKGTSITLRLPKVNACQAVPELQIESTHGN